MIFYDGIYGSATAPLFAISVTRAINAGTVMCESDHYGNIIVIAMYAVSDETDEQRPSARRFRQRHRRID